MPRLTRSTPRSLSAALRGGRKLLGGCALALAAGAASDAAAQTQLPPPPEAGGGWVAAEAAAADSPAGLPSAAAPGAQFCGPDAHPVSRKYVTPHDDYLPRRNLLKDARTAASGLYGSLDYMNLRIEEAPAIIGTSRILGSPTFNPFTGDRRQNPFVFGDPSITNITLDVDTQLIVPELNVGALDLTEPILLAPAPLTSEFDKVDIRAANPFYIPLENVVGGDLPAPLIDLNAEPPIFYDESPNALLFVPNTSRLDFENVPAIRGTVGYRWTSGIAFEASVFGAESQTADFSIELDGDLSEGLSPESRDINPDRSFDPLDDDVFDSTVAVPDGIDEDDQRRRRLAFIPVNVSDAFLGTDDLGRDQFGGRTVPLFYDGDLTASYRTDLLNADGQVFIPVHKGDRRWRFDFSMGARYLNVDEGMAVSALQQQPLFELRNAGGDFPTADDLIPDPVTGDPGEPDILVYRFGINPVGDPRQTFIGSDVDNHVYAAQLGFRTELDLEPFTLGVAPRLGLGANSYNASVTTANLFGTPDLDALQSPDALTFTRSDDGTNFSASLDLNVYAKMRLREWLSFNVGYQLLMVDGIQRAPDAVDYNTSFAVPALGVQKKDTKMTVDGLTLGFEVLLP